MRVVGIEIGAREVRVARGERRLGRARVTDVERIAFADAADREAVLRRLAAEASGAEVTIAFPLALAAHRILDLPFRDRRRLTEVVPLELAGQLPSDPGEVASAFVPLRTTAAGASVLAALARRVDVDDARRAFPGARVSLGAPAAWAALDPDRVANAALVVADGASSTVGVRRDGRLVGLRALATPASSRAAFVAEVRWTLAALGGAPALVVGGPDADAGLAGALGEATGSAVRPLALVALTGGDNPALAACLTATGLVREPGLVLAAGDARPAAAGSTRRRVAGLAAAALLLGLVDLLLVRGALARRDAMLGAAIEAEAAAALPPGTRLVAPREQLEAAVAGQAARPPATSAVLALLRELSERVPASVRLDLDELAVDGDALRLHGRAESFEAVDVLQRALAASTFLGEVTADDARAAVDGRGVEFGLRATWRQVAGAPS